MEKQKWKKIEKRLLDNSFFLFEKDNSVMFFFFSCDQRRREKENKWFGLIEKTKHDVVLRCVWIV